MSTLSLGQELRVRKKEDAQDYYRSRLLDWTSEEWIIAEPLHQADSTAFGHPSGAPFWVEYVSGDGAICKFRTEFRGLMFNPIYAWRVTKPRADKIIREQRRKFVRVPTDITVHMDVKVGGHMKEIAVHTRDISGGGVAVYLPRGIQLEPGSLAMVKFTLPVSNIPVEAKCFVVRVSEPNEQGVRVVSMQFLNLKESVQKRIVQFTFQRQRLLQS